MNHNVPKVLLDMILEEDYAENVLCLEAIEALWAEDFIVVLERDGNRVDDALALWRKNEVYSRETVSVLEIVISLAKRMDEIMTEDPRVDESRRWFWELIQNLGIFGKQRGQAGRIIQRFVQRSYSPTGHGGLFPLNFPKEDQRQVEIWYQMQAYLIEKYD